MVLGKQGEMQIVQESAEKLLEGQTSAAFLGEIGPEEQTIGGRAAT